MSIAATLPLEDAAARVWDVVVIGAGPAGAMAAYQLARRRTDVLLVDKASFPRFKVCGCCLNVRALMALSAASLGNLVTRHGGVRLHRVHLAAWGRSAFLPLPDGAALSRETFDAALVQAAINAGAAFLPQTHASALSHNPAGNGHATRRVLLHREHHPVEVQARVILIANGLGSRLLADEPEFRAPVAPGSRIGAGTIADEAPAFYQPGTIFMASAAGGYVGLVRLEDGRLDLGAALDPHLVKRAGGLGTAATWVLADAGFPAVPAVADLPWRGTPPLTRRLLPVAYERAFVLGDAASYVEPFTGEGISWALAAGSAVAPIAQKAAQRWDPELALRWSVCYRQLIARRQRACRAVAKVLRQPLLIRGMVGVLSRLPVLAAPLIRYLNWSGKRLQAPGYRLQQAEAAVCSL